MPAATPMRVSPHHNPVSGPAWPTDFRESAGCSMLRADFLDIEICDPWQRRPRKFKKKPGESAALTKGMRSAPICKKDRWVIICARKPGARNVHAICNSSSDRSQTRHHQRFHQRVQSSKVGSSPFGNKVFLDLGRFVFLILTTRILKDCKFSPVSHIRRGGQQDPEEWAGNGGLLIFDYRSLDRVGRYAEHRLYTL